MSDSILLAYSNESHDPQLSGKRFYQPWVLAAYCILANLPFATLLYSLNIFRRGNIWMGRILFVGSTLAVIGICIDSAIGTSDRHRIPIFLFNLFMGIGLMKAEQHNYQKAILKGGLPARWWPPLLFLAAMVLTLMGCVWLFDLE